MELQPELYSTWDSYKTVFGHDLVNQAWGSGVMTLKTTDLASRTTIDPITAEVKFEIPKVGANMTANPKVLSKKSTVYIHPNPVKNELFIQSEQPVCSLLLYNYMGVLQNNYENVTVISTVSLKHGIYFLRVNSANGNEILKFIKG
jgi:hypothetical protein